MPRFYFNLRDGRFYPDEEGSLHSGLESACQEALKAARGMMADVLNQGAPLDLEERIEIVDEQGEVLAIVTFREAAGLVGPDASGASDAKL